MKKHITLQQLNCKDSITRSFVFVASRHQLPNNLAHVNAGSRWDYVVKEIRMLASASFGL